ncbi:MAG: methyltransferase [Acidobacteria bacterium]|nr:methyltransferase [Acidobacteriota bacterium]
MSAALPEIQSPGWRAGVSPVDWDTRLLADLAAQLAPRTALDVGTGSGYITVALAGQGVQCTATDINPAALAQAREFAAARGSTIDFVRSDLFDQVHGRFDLIVFNPPYGHTGSSGAARLEYLKSLVPKENPIVRRVVYEFVRPGRLRLIDRFLLQALDHLTPGGSVLLLAHRRELPLATGWCCDVMASRDEFRALRLTPENNREPR